MNVTPSMNDDEMLATLHAVLTAARESRDDIPARRPVDELISIGRVRRARRARVICAAMSCIVAGVVAVALIAVNDRTAGSNARMVAYVTSRVEKALAGGNLVFVGRSDSNLWGNTVTWAYGSRNRFEEYWPNADYQDRVVNGQRLWDFPPQDRGLPYLAQGTALAGGKLVSAYVTYFDRKYSLSPLGPQPVSACSTSAALSMPAPIIPTTHWSAFIDGTLACGAASATGHVLVDGMPTVQITGKPITVRLQPGMAKAVGAKWATARWTLYVNPATYLPVRMSGSTETFGGRAGRYTSSSVTNVQWLPPTSANIAQTLVTIPPGFYQVSSPADQ
jgi:hypothetical protein